MTARLWHHNSTTIPNPIIDVEHEGKGATWMFDTASPSFAEIQRKYRELARRLRGGE